MAARRAADAYRAAALIVFNTFILFVVANIVAGVALHVRDRRKKVQLGRLVVEYGLDHVARAYPGMARADVEQLQAETNRTNALEYAPYTIFKTTPMAGRFVNIDPAGFRRNREQCAWPPPKNVPTVFAFGGSTTFGTGIADAETIPSYLQDELRKRGAASVCVYNFAQPGWSSPNERIAFQQLLVAGRAPTAAVFVDGLNEFRYDDMAALLRASLHRATYPNWRYSLADTIFALPLGRIARSIARRSAPAPVFTPIPPAGAVDRWLESCRLTSAMGRTASTHMLFAWQPVPTYEYDMRQHLFARTVPQPWMGTGAWQILDRQRASRPLGDEMLWLGDIQRGMKANLYVDEFHYNPLLTRAIAAAIADALCERGALPCAQSKLPVKSNGT